MVSENYLIESFVCTPRVND